MVKHIVRGKKIRFRINLPEAKTVQLVGDFNYWNQEIHTLKRLKSGDWTIDLKLADGEYQFRYFVDQSRWHNDEDLPTVDNPFGGKNSLVMVNFADHGK